VEGVRVAAIPGTAIADRLGSARAGNMVLLGALLEATGLLPDEALVRALHRLVRQDGWYELDRAALAAGREEARHTPILAGARLRVPA
jgi:Pyruvate/2-oxoacid:ferredoxin oxidoreductase gamma subunit